MTEELNENIDSQIDADEVVTSEEEQTTEDSKDELTDREKQFLARAKKAEGKLKDVKANFEEPKVPEPNKPKTEHGTPTIEHMALLARDPDIEKLKLAEDYSKLKGISITDAYNSSIMQSEFNEMNRQTQIKANSMPASTGGAPAPREKTPGNMTEAEHREWAQSKLAGAINK